MARQKLLENKTPGTYKLQILIENPGVFFLVVYKANKERLIRFKSIKHRQDI